MEKNATPAVSIVIPVHNAEQYIEQTVRSVEAQTEQDFELLLVEDGSNDASAQILKKLAAEDVRIRVLVNGEPHGACHARNCGIREAKGRYLAFLDADDLWLPEKLAKSLAYMKEKDGAFVFTAYEFGDREANGTGKIVHVPEHLTYRQALPRTVIFTSTVVFDLTRLRKEQIYMPEITSEDTATWWNILRSGVTAYGLDENLVTYRRAGKSLSSNKLEAIRRIWILYRKNEKLGILPSLYYLCGWAVRAVARRL
ncbi:MAG: glycosyltransferase family 2 protein [Lachnospiraceae bacterium]|nr:glycosyltransferase family 2 protein [Lachnospiraceae bacterium]